MGKRKYRAISVKQVVVERVVEKLEHERVVFAIDVAKEVMYAAVMDRPQQAAVTVRWRHPAETRECLAMVEQLRSSGKQVEVAMEPSGSYGDALRSLFEGAQFPVHRVSPKRSHDAAEVYDGVPSLHDAKSAAIVGKLHLDGLSERWEVTAGERRQVVARLRVLEVFQKQFESNRNRLEGLLARYWPELTQYVALDSATLLELLSEYGGPAQVAEQPAAAAQLMRRVGGFLLAQERIDGAVQSAHTSLGVSQLAEENALVQAIAREARRNQKAVLAAKKEVEAFTATDETAGHLAVVIGKTSAAVVVASLGSPREHRSAKAFEKALGLNLKEKSSGKNSECGLHITKRGPSLARMYLYFAVLRLIQTDPVIAAWYARKVARDGGKAKAKAIVAIMRKLARALWHVAKGNEFDATKLFDVRRLKLVAPSAS